MTPATGAPKTDRLLSFESHPDVAARDLVAGAAGPDRRHQIGVDLSRKTRNQRQAEAGTPGPASGADAIVRYGQKEATGDRLQAYLHHAGGFGQSVFERIAHQFGRDHGQRGCDPWPGDRGMKVLADFGAAIRGADVRHVLTHVPEKVVQTNLVPRPLLEPLMKAHYDANPPTGLAQNSGRFGRSSPAFKSQQADNPLQTVANLMMGCPDGVQGLTSAA